MKELESEAAFLGKLHQAHQQVTFGGKYRHYKNRSQHYKVQGFVIIEETGSVGIVYQAQYGEYLTFVRPLKSWLAEVEVDGKKVPRFKEIKETIK